MAGKVEAGLPQEKCSTFLACAYSDRKTGIPFCGYALPVEDRQACSGLATRTSKISARRITASRCDARRHRLLDRAWLSARRCSAPAQHQSVERRNSGALSEFAGSDLTGSIPALSTCGVSTRADTPARDASAERVCSRGGCSERGRATARAISICAAP